MQPLPHYHQTVQRLAKRLLGLREEFRQRAGDDALRRAAPDAGKCDRECRVRREGAGLTFRFDLDELGDGLWNRHVAWGLVYLPASVFWESSISSYIYDTGEREEGEEEGGQGEGRRHTWRGSLRSAL